MVPLLDPWLRKPAGRKFLACSRRESLSLRTGLPSLADVSVIVVAAVDRIVQFIVFSFPTGVSPLSAFELSPADVEIGSSTGSNSISRHFQDVELWTGVLISKEKSTLNLRGLLFLSTGIISSGKLAVCGTGQRQAGFSRKHLWKILSRSIAWVRRELNNFAARSCLFDLDGDAGCFAKRSS